MHEHEKLNYIELPSKDLAATKAFFKSAFKWDFEDFGPYYTAFKNQGLDGGFFQSNLSSLTENGSALAVFYSQTLEQTLQKVLDAGGVILKPIFEFPGGRRFHFTEPGGSEFAVWSDVE